MNNDAAQHDLSHVLALAQEQMRDLSVMQQRQSELTAKGFAADETVEVTVDAQRVVTETVIDESYLDEFEIADLGGHITAAAQSAAKEIERQTTALLAPLIERRSEMWALSGGVTDAPDLHDLMSKLSSFAPAETRDGVDRDEGEFSFPVVRR